MSTVHGGLGNAQAAQPVHNKVDSITRREFLEGAAVCAAGAAGLRAAPALAEEPALTPRPAAQWGGQTERDRSVAHAWRDAGFALKPEPKLDDEAVDLVVVGAGISGLAAAWWYRLHAGRPVRIVLLEAADEVGGNAIRNDFTTKDGHRLIGYGGSQSLDSPSCFSPAAKHLIDAVGIPLQRFEREWFDRGWAKRHGVEGHAYFFDASRWGRSATVVQRGQNWMERTPLVPKAQADWQRLAKSPAAPLPGAATPKARCDALIALTYRDYLRKHWGVHDDLLRVLQPHTAGYLGAGIDAVTALDAWAMGLPGFKGLDLGEALDPRLAPSAALTQYSKDPYIFHFPDGNHGVVRSLVRALMPQALAIGEGIKTNPAWDCTAINPQALDAAGQPVRCRLQATVLRATQAGDGANVDYVDGSGQLRRLRTRHVVMACWSRSIAHLLPELGAAQREALLDQVKVPLVYANVLLGNWKPFARLGVKAITPADGFWHEMGLDFPVAMGGQTPPARPQDPILVHLGKVVLPPPTEPALNPRAQYQLGRQALQSHTFASIEGEIRALMQGALGAAGFDYDRDVHAITINRWAHGYAYEYMRPWDSFWPDGPLPCVRARAKLGNIAIAGSDAGAYAYAHSAIDQAARAVQELLPHAHIPAFALRPGPWLG